MEHQNIRNGKTVDKEKLKQEVYYYISSLTHENGITDGFLNINNPIFLDYLKHNHESILVEQRINANETQIKEARAAIYKINNCSEKVILSNHQITQLEEDIEEKREKIKKIGQKQEVQEQKKENLVAKNSLFAALLFLIAGFLFIIADLLLTKDILVNAMDFNPNSLETWLLATAISGLAFALKPLVDYFFNQTAELGKKHKIYLLYGISIIVVATLLFLGVYRTSYINTEDAIVGKERELQLIQDQLLIENNPALIQQAKESSSLLMEEIKALEATMVNNWSFVVSIALLSFLFAIVGAICFSVSFPDLRLFTQKLNLKRSISKLSKEQKNISTQIKRNQNLKTEKLAERDQALTTVKLMDRPAKAYHEVLTQLINRRESLLQDYSQAIVEADKSWYEVCRIRGLHYKSGGNYTPPHRKSSTPISEIVKKNIYNTVPVFHGNGVKNGTPFLKNGLGETPYLHEYLRNKVGNQYTENKTKTKTNPSSNGKKV